MKRRKKRMVGWEWRCKVLAGRFWGRKMGEKGLENFHTHSFTCKKVRSGSLQIEAVKRAGGAAELIGLDAEVLKHADIEIAKRWWVIRIEGEMLAVFETTTGEKGGQVLGGVAAAITEVAAEEDGGAVEQAAACVLGLTEFC